MGSCTRVDRDGELLYFTWTEQTEGGFKVDGGTGRWNGATGAAGSWKAAGNIGRNTWEGTITLEK